MEGDEKEHLGELDLHQLDSFKCVSTVAPVKSLRSASSALQLQQIGYSAALHALRQKIGDIACHTCKAQANKIRGQPCSRERVTSKPGLFTAAVIA